MLGSVGWERADWVGAYYPADLPPDWRLAYYANDAGCVLLPSEVWLAAGAAAREALDEAPEELTFFLLLPGQGDSRLRSGLSAFGGRRVVLLGDTGVAAPGEWPLWTAQGPDTWVDDDSGACLARWWLESADLRQLRQRAESLPASLAALVIDGPAASPAVVPELRQLLELMGWG